MRRGFLLGACLLLATASGSRANYLIIRVILKTPDATAVGGGPLNGNEGGGPGPGGLLGSPPMGIGGGPPMGIGGLPPPGGGGRFGVGGGARGIMGEGGPGGPGPGGLAMFGNLGGGGALGQVGNLGGTGGQRQQPKEKLKLASSDYVMVAVEFKQKDVQTAAYIQPPKPDYLIKTKWGGKAVLFQDGTEILIQTLPDATPREKYDARVTKLRHTPDGLLNHAEWCLQHGLVDETMKTLDEFVKVLEATKEKEKDSDRLRKIAEVYGKLRPELGRGVLKKETAVAWKNRLGGTYTITDNEFYSLIHSATANERDLIQRRLKLLDTTLKNFYLWHAMKGKALPLPTEKLVAVLLDSEQAYRQYKSSFDGDDLLPDGFLARRDNLAIFYSGRLDAGYQNFQSKIRSLNKDYKPDELMAGKFPKEARDPKQRQEAARAMMLYLVDKALQEEGEISSTSHEGTRQLFAATGLLPRNVDIPEWLQFGLASLFEMPRGPFFGDFTEIKVALWPGAGAPSWAYMGHFNELYKKKELGTPFDTLADTITDDYFVLARDGIKSRKQMAKTPKEIGQIEALKEELLARAHAMSWSLAYFLANDSPKRLDQLHQYFVELGKLPRDLELDEAAKQLAFAKAFGLSRTGLTVDGIDPKKVNAFAMEWIQFMQTLRSPASELKLDEINSPTEGGGLGGPPGPGEGPGGPGGFPGGPGGPGGGPGGLGGAGAGAGKN